MSGKPGFKAVSAVLCALLFCAELTGGYVEAGFDAFRRVTERKSTSSGGGGPKKPTSIPTYSEETVVPSNFDIQAELVSAAAAPLSSDSFGVFQMTCVGGQVTRDDPVAYPAQPGKSHLQQFFGNESATAYSTYASLRGGGSSTCMSRVDRSLYSIPAMLDGRGNMVRPDFSALTFKRRPTSDANCQPSGGTGGCIAFPNGLKFVFGYDPAKPTERSGNPRFSCEGATAGRGEFNTITQAAAYCPSQPSGGVYNKLVATLDAPSCWDGKNLDSADHRSHTAYPVDGWLSTAQCPSTHPFQIPGLSMSVRYTVDDGVANWRFSSDETVQGAQPGMTFRATWVGAWDNQVMGMWVQNCINKKLGCPSANLGNGKAVRASSGFVTTANPRLVALNPQSPTPTPTPTPAPTPSPTPSPTTHIENKVAAEGDSISVYAPGNYTGLYDSSRSAVTVCGLAVGGSDIEAVTRRISGVTTCNGEVVTLLIGANDMYNGQMSITLDMWLAKVWAYTDSLRAQGYKVAMGTILPQYNINGSAYMTEFTRRRPLANAAIRAAVGAHIDAVIDFAADPTIGPDSAAANPALYPDGLHPSASAQATMSTIYGPVVDRLLAR
jgi:lysophospholipase L1-like esterase